MKQKQMIKRSMALVLALAMVFSLRAPVRAQGENGSEAEDWVTSSEKVTVKGEAENGYQLSTTDPSAAALLKTPVDFSWQAIQFTLDSNLEEGNWVYMYLKETSKGQSVSGFGGGWLDESGGEITLQFKRVGANLRIAMIARWWDGNEFGTIENFAWDEPHTLRIVDCSDEGDDNCYLQIDNVVFKTTTVDDARKHMSTNGKYFRNHGGAYLTVGTHDNINCPKMIKILNEPDWTADEKAVVTKNMDGYNVTVAGIGDGNQPAAAAYWNKPIDITKDAVCMKADIPVANWAYLSFSVAPNLAGTNSFTSFGSDMNNLAIILERSGDNKLTVRQQGGWDRPEKKTIDFDWSVAHTYALIKETDGVWYLGINEEKISLEGFWGVDVNQVCENYVSKGGAYLTLGAHDTTAIYTNVKKVSIPDYTDWTYNAKAEAEKEADGYKVRVAGNAKVNPAAAYLNEKVDIMQNVVRMKVDIPDGRWAYISFGDSTPELSVSDTFTTLGGKSSNLPIVLECTGDKKLTVKMPGAGNWWEMNRLDDADNFDWTAEHTFALRKEAGNWVLQVDTKTIAFPTDRQATINSLCESYVTGGGAYLTLGAWDITAVYSSVKMVEKVTVLVTSENVEASDAQVPGADLKGSGAYPIGGKVIVEAPEVEGYSFLGWYRTDDNSNFFTGERIYTFEAKEDLSLTARYRETGTGEIKITVIDGNKSETKTPDDGKVTVTATGDKFMYWTNQAGVIVSRSAEYTFTAVVSDVLTAHYEADQEKCMVVWESFYGQVIRKGVYSAEDKIEAPAVPSRFGYASGAWDKDEAAIKEAIQSKELMITVRPVYTELSSGKYTLTVVNGTQDRYDGIYRTNEVATVRAEAEKDGRRFSYWLGYKTGTAEETEKKILSYDKVYKFYVTQDYTLEAVYEENAAEAKGTAEIVEVKPDAANGRLSFVAMLTVPQGCTLEYGGILATSDKSKVNKDNKLDKDRVEYVRVVKKEVDILRYVWNKSNVTADQTWYVCPYLVYTDKDGNCKEIVGSMVKVENFEAANDIAADEDSE